MEAITAIKQMPLIGKIILASITIGCLVAIIYSVIR